MTTPAKSGGITAIDPSTHQIVHDLVLSWLHKAGFTNISEIDYDRALGQTGIDSLGIVEIAAELEQRTRKKLNPDLIFELENINDLAEYIDSLPIVIDRPVLENQNGQQPATTPVPADLPSTNGAHKRKAHPNRSPVARYELLNRRVSSLKEQGHYFFEPEISQHDGTWVVVDDQRLLMMASYDYLGLVSNSLLKGAAVHAINTFGTGHHGARLLAGTTSVHKRLEARLAELMGADDAILFGSGYVTNLAVISSLVGPGDCVIGDQWNHASIVDGCRMSGADFLIFDHNDMSSLEDCLQKSGEQHTLVAVDAVYSMDGDIAPIPEVVQLCRRHNALLMVDEAHSLGVMGATGGGIQEHFGLDNLDIDIKMGTISKSLASSGGFVAASHEIVSYLRHHARGYIFSGALSVAQANAAITALDILREEPFRVQQLWKNVRHYSEGLTSLGFDIGETASPIVPIMTKDVESTLRMTSFCRQAGVLVAPVGYPAVPMDAPRLRTCVSAIHSEDDIQLALRVLAAAGRDAGLISR